MKTTESIPQSRTYRYAAIAAFACVLGMYAAPASAQQKVIQSFDASRSICGASFASGAPYSDARQIATELGYTIRGGVPRIHVGALLGVDVFFINPIGDPLSPVEICRLESFVRRGGGVIDARNMNSPSIFGVKQAAFTGVNPGTAHFINLDSTAVQALSQGIPTTAGASGIGASSILDPAGALPFLAADQDTSVRGVLVCENAGSAGRAVIIGDEEVFWSEGATCAGVDYINDTYNPQLFENALLWATKNPARSAALTPDSDGDGMDDRCDPSPYIAAP